MRAQRQGDMSQLVWRRMAQLPQQNAPFATHFNDPLTTARELQTAFTVLDVGSCRGPSGHGSGFWLRSASLA